MNVFSVKKKDGLIQTLHVIAAILLLSLTLFNMIDGKQAVMGTVMFSDFKKCHAPTEFACYVGFTSMILYIISIVVLVIGSFLPLTKKPKYFPYLKEKSEISGLSFLMFYIL